MKTTLAVVLLALSLSLCNLMGRRGNTNTNGNSRSSGEMAEASPTPGEIPPPSAPAQNSNRNTDTAPPRDLRAAPPAAAPGVPGSMPTSNHNSAARVPQPPKTISGGVLNGKATRLVQPAYPAIARAAHASGQVRVQVLVDENGNVVSAIPVSGHPLLQSSAVAAARQSKFSPTMLSGQPVKVTGVIIYNFVAQ